MGLGSVGTGGGGTLGRLGAGLGFGALIAGFGSHRLVGLDGRHCALCPCGGCCTDAVLAAVAGLHFGGGVLGGLGPHAALVEAAMSRVGFCIATHTMSTPARNMTPAELQD